MPGAYLLQGDARAIPLADGSVQMVCTSPPYWGLRSYSTQPLTWPDGWSGELGLEPTPELYVAHMVEVFREVRRVLRDDGTCWLNLGDSYAGSKTENTNGTSRIEPNVICRECLVGIVEEMLSILVCPHTTDPPKYPAACRACREGAL